MSALHIYAFGSICRGEISAGSDVDLLAAVSGGQNDLDRCMFSIYSHLRLKEIWSEGNPFAWHLHHEARLIHASDGRNFLDDLGIPRRYCRRYQDCERFLQLLQQARSSVDRDHGSVIFDLSAAFLGLRNFASCYVLGNVGEHDFSRNVAVRLMGHNPPISVAAYKILERARLLCTRGYGELLASAEVDCGLGSLPALEAWMSLLLQEIADEQ
jgi:DNA-directed RNA polymerase subunit N (RpoN/RPB10)